MKRIVMISVIGALSAALLLGCSEDTTQAHTGPGSRQAVAERPSYSNAGDSTELAERGGWGGQASRADTAPVVVAQPIEAAETYSGTLAYKDPEWYLDTGSELILLHLGNRTYLESVGDDLEVGAEASADGIMEEDGLEVSKLTIGGNTLVIRDTDGRPAWSGSRGWDAEAEENSQNDDSQSTDTFAARGQGRGRSSGGRGRGLESSEAESTERGNIVYEGEHYNL